MAKITIIENNSNDKDNVRAFFLKGEKGEAGETGNGIESIEKTGSTGNIDTYTITFSNGSTYDFNVANGEGATIVVDNLTDTSSNKALSANQGKILKDMIDNMAEINTLSSDIILSDGNASTLEEGFYYTDTHSVIFQGTSSSQTVIGNYELFYFNNSSQTFITPAFQMYYTSDTNKWAKDLNSYNTDTIVDDNFKIPTSKAVYDAINDTNRMYVTGYYYGTYDFTTGTGTDPQLINLDFMPCAVIVIGTSMGSPTVPKYFIGAGIREFGVDVEGDSSGSIYIGSNEVLINNRNGFYAHGYANDNGCKYNYIAFR